MQLTYSSDRGVGYPGMIDGVNSGKRVVNKSLETATIKPGLVVSRGTDKENQAVLGGTAPIGVVARTMNKEMNAAGELEYVATDSINVITSGEVKVALGSTGTAGDPIFSVDATGVIEAGTASTGETQLNGVLDQTAGTIGDIVRIILTEQNN